MKQVLTIFLLCVMAALHTPAGQLLKIPVLVSHYLKHQKLEGISFVSFLEEHYAARHQDADFPEDEQLPFKAVISYSIGYAIVTGMIQTPAHIPQLAEKKAIVVNANITRMYPGSIFRPPRIPLFPC